MASNRRNFLRNLTLGTGALVTGVPTMANVLTDEMDRSNLVDHQSKPAGFNMSGYAAPKLDKVRIGMVGLGMRGPGAVSRMSFIEGVEIKALCDVFPERVASAQKILEKRDCPKPQNTAAVKMPGRKCAIGKISI